ncbi:hypothetical protein [Gloeothece verrucosa]|uniref:Transmembrane protein n=1 Tax=Gloeothece verrucosa (strain PCC 7822) TaxID=497965 RepID=E0UBY7_GLOV7|nr:hypothetical protein [Gloeothece verrucosa]ADN15202.1 hypothetical protein Cyan7822_3252 [Gloeothece verrucosa PCC 7822]
MQNLKLMLMRLFVVTSSAMAIATLANFYNYQSYWQGTIVRVQNVYFNLLFHTLPTKLSYTLIQNNEEEMQRTLDSNYGLFGLVITNCKTDLPDCPNQQIVYTSRSNLALKDNLTPESLYQSPYSVLQNPPPLFTEKYFNNPDSKILEKTGKVNQGKIFGRVYYIRSTPPSFQKDLATWVKASPESLFNADGANKYYTLTYSLFLSGGLGAWWFLERILQQKQKKQDSLLKENQRLAKETEKSQKRLKQLMKQLTRLNEELKAEYQVKQELIQIYQQKTQALQEQINQLLNEQNIPFLEKQLVKKSLNGFSPNFNQEPAYQQEKQQEIKVLHKNQLLLLEPTEASTLQTLEQLQKELTKIENQQQKAEEKALILQKSINKLEQKYQEVEEQYRSNTIELLKHKKQELNLSTVRSRLNYSLQNSNKTIQESQEWLDLYEVMSKLMGSQI